MKILILGAGQVGGTLAENLANEAFDITLVDNNATVLDELRDKLDIQTVHGSGSHPDVLRRAGADDADMLIAVTSSDEVNMVACQVCYSLFRTPTKIARIRSSSYLGREGFFSKEHMPIDVLINPEEVVTTNIRQLLEHPGALQVLDFADGRVQLVAVKAYYGGPLVGQELRFLRQHMPNVDTRVAAIYPPRQGHDSRGQHGDRGRRRGVLHRRARAHQRGDGRATEGRAALQADHDRRRRQHRGRAWPRPSSPFSPSRLWNTAKRAVKSWQTRYTSRWCSTWTQPIASACWKKTSSSVTLSARSPTTTRSTSCRHCSPKRLGVRQVITLIGKPAYVDLVQGGDIDIAISPQQATTSSLLSYVRRADVAAVHSLRRGAAEAIEAIAHGDAKTSKVVGRAIGDIELPAGTTIGALVRGDRVLIAHDDLVIETDDHVIMFLVDKRQVTAVERMFQVGLTFF